MKEKTYGIVLGILNIALLVVCGVLFMGKDNNPPEIFLMNADFVYAAETEEETLFQGVTAVDKEDGELTEAIVIEKIVTDIEKETATITYGVADSAGNVGKATCTVEMEVPEIKEESEVLKKENVGNTLELESEPEENEQSENEEEDALEEENTEDDLGEGEETEEAENADSNVEALPTAGEAGNGNQITASSRQNTGRPTMVFRKQEVTVQAGSAPAWVNLIEGLHDDKDNYETLLKSLQIKGDYDKNKAGVYNVTVTVTDADGNESNAYPVKITVE